MNTDPIPIIIREFPTNSPASIQVQEFYDRWEMLNETQQRFEQTERNLHYAAKTNTSLIGNAADIKRDQQERAAALPVLKLSVLEALERVERIPDKALQTLSEDDRISLSQAKTRDDELTQLQERFQVEERDNDRER
jgi:hypothetical protein